MRHAGLRRFVALVERHNGNTISGQPTYNVDADWVPVSGMTELPVSYEEVSGGETARGQKMEAGVTGLITVPSTPRTRSITHSMRLRVEGKKLNIVRIMDSTGLRRELMIEVSEKR